MHLHGFASSSRSRKGIYLAGAFAARGLCLELPELNQPSFARLTYSAALEALDLLYSLGSLAGSRWRLSGSSLGAYLAARWAELHPERVDRLVLLSPGFNLVERWPALLGDGAMARWEREGVLSLPDAVGELVPVHWSFIEDARGHPRRPEVPCPTLIMHGRGDETVPIEHSRSYAEARPDRVRLIELDDDHSLLGSLERICREVFAFYGLAGGST